jgi:hypothetical protein
MKQDYTGFVAEFRSEQALVEVLKRNNVTIPDEWKYGLNNFKVVTDLGRHLELAFWDWESDEQKGTTAHNITVDIDEVICWA